MDFQQRLVKININLTTAGSLKAVQEIKTINDVSLSCLRLHLMIRVNAESIAYTVILNEQWVYTAKTVIHLLEIPGKIDNMSKHKKDYSPVKLGECDLSSFTIIWNFNNLSKAD